MAASWKKKIQINQIIQRKKILCLIKIYFNEKAVLFGLEEIKIWSYLLHENIYVAFNQF